MTKHLTICPHCGGDLEGQFDGRADFWHARLRLYDMEVNPDDPMPGADSDAGLSPDKPGATQIRGLWKVLSNAATQAADYHANFLGEPATLRGFDTDTLDRKLRGIRSTLSRNRGRACFRIEYDTADSFRPDPERKPRYLARVDVVKANGGNNGA